MIEVPSPEMQAYIFDQFPQFRLVTAKDQMKLRAFLRDTPMETPLVSLSYDRGTDYVGSLEEQGHCVMGWLIEDENGEIEGLAHLYIKKVYWQGRIFDCGYLGDLRIKHGASGELRRQFRKLYKTFLETFKKIPEVSSCEFFLAAILGGNQRAISSLVRPNKYFRYHLVGQYQTQTVFWRTPRLPTLFKYRVRWGHKTEGFEPEHLNLQECTSDTKDVFSLLDRRNQVIAHFSLWAPKKKLYFNKMSLPLKVIGQVPRILGRRSLSEKESLNALYLSDISFKKGIASSDRTEALRKMIDFAYEQFKERDHQALILSGPDGWQIREVLKQNGYVFLPGQGALFQVTANDTPKSIQVDDFYFDVSRS